LLFFLWICNTIRTSGLQAIAQRWMSDKNVDDRQLTNRRICEISTHPVLRWQYHFFKTEPTRFKKKIQEEGWATDE